MHLLLYSIDAPLLLTQLQQRNMVPKSLRSLWAFLLSAVLIIPAVMLFPAPSQAMVNAESQSIQNVDKPQVAPINANVQLITTAAGNGADTFIRGGSYSSKNNGTNGKLVVKLDNTVSYIRKTYLRFDLSELNDGIDDVSLNLSTINLPNTKGSIEFYGLNDGVEENWSETKTTWNNAPGNDTCSTNLFLSNQTTYLGKLPAASIATGDSFSFNSPELLDFIKGDTDDIVTILINRAEYKAPDAYIVFASKESTEYSPPTLMATLKPAVQSNPETDTANLFELPDCVNSDCNCSDFKTQEEAQAVFNYFGDDRFRLDGNKDGLACTSLPHAKAP